MATRQSSQAAAIRAKVKHPIIDSDGHILEVVPVWMDYVRQVGGTDAVKRVEKGGLSDEDFRDFSFANPVRLFAGMNRDFFKGTRVEREAAEVLRQAP